MVIIEDLVTFFERNSSTSGNRTIVDVHPRYKHCKRHKNVYFINSLKIYVVYGHVIDVITWDIQWSSVDSAVIGTSAHCEVSLLTLDRIKR